MAIAQQSVDPRVRFQAELVNELVDGYEPRDIAVRFWDGSTSEPAPGQPARFTLVLRHPGALRKTFWPPRPLTLGQAYLYDDFDVEGDMVAFCMFCRHLSSLKGRLTPAQQLRLGWRLWNLPRVERPRDGRQAAQLSGQVHSLERDLAAIRYHYDTSNEFFQLALGPRLVYTSAIWNDRDEDLETAQTRKLDRLYRKLRLRPGERLLDIGCGWGAPLLHAVTHYGVQGLGVTLSMKQADWAKRLVRQEGRDDRCRIEVRDYRELDEGEPFDKIVMMEVGEHFGADQFLPFFQKCYRLLRPGGALAIQQITLSGRIGMPAGREFSQHYVFPDGELVPVSTLVRDAERAGFDVRDVEGLREHYPITLGHWLRNLETHHDKLVALTDEATYRTFRFYFAGARMGFLTNVYNLHQLLVVKPDGYSSHMPLSRADRYD